MVEAGLNAVAGRRLDTPRRETLLEHYARTEAFCKTVIALEALVVAGLVGWMAWRGDDVFSTASVAAFVLGALGVFRWFPHHVFLNKKRLEEIRPDAQFGMHTRDSLLALTQQVFQRLGLKPGQAPVFLTRAKDVNAHAVRCELWPGLHLFNGVFLNRSIIHLLDERELASVIGHELGHVFPYAPLLSRCYLLHALFAGTVSFSIASLFNVPALAFVAPLGVLWLLDGLIAFPHARLSRAIEFLCDDHGARAAGLLPALSSEMKIAAEQETRQRLLLRLCEARLQGTRLNLAELTEAYEEAVPFGKADPESFEREFQERVSRKKRAPGGISLRGFLNHLQGESGEAEDWAREQATQLKRLSELPLISLDRSAYLQGSQAWSLESTERLIAAIEREPNRLLFQLAEEIDDRSSSHPNASRRLLFLWRNRENATFKDSFSFA